MFDDSKGVHVIRSRISEKGRQYNDQKEGQTIQWPKRKRIKYQQQIDIQNTTHKTEYWAT